LPPPSSATGGREGGRERESRLERRENTFELDVIDGVRKDWIR